MVHSCLGLRVAAKTEGGSAQRRCGVAFTLLRLQVVLPFNSRPLHGSNCHNGKRTQTGGSSKNKRQHPRGKRRQPNKGAHATLMKANLYSIACAGICEWPGTVEGTGRMSHVKTSSELPKSMKRTVHLSPLRASTAARYHASSAENLATHISPIFAVNPATGFTTMAARRSVMWSICFSEPGTCTQKATGEIISVIVTCPSSEPPEFSTSSAADSAVRAASSSWSYFSHVRSLLFCANCPAERARGKVRERRTEGQAKDRRVSVLLASECAVCSYAGHRFTCVCMALRYKCRSCEEIVRLKSKTSTQ